MVPPSHFVALSLSILIVLPDLALTLSSQPKGRWLPSPFDDHLEPRVHLRAASPDHNVTFKMHLNGERFHELEAKMNEIVETGGSWLTVEELRAYVTPSAEAKSAIESLFAQHDIDSSLFSYSDMQDQITVTAPTASVAKLFRTAFNNVVDPLNRRNVVRAGDLWLHESIADHVIHVSGLHPGHTVPHRGRLRSSRANSFQSAKPMLNSATSVGHHAADDAKEICTTTQVNWNCIRKRYGVAGVRTPLHAESVAVINFSGLWTDDTIRTFQMWYGESDLEPIIPNKRAFNGQEAVWNSHKYLDDNSETVVDISALLGIAPTLNLSTWFSAEASSRGSCDVEEAALRHFVGMTAEERPGVVSLSYGTIDAWVHRSASESFCRVVQQLTALGTTFVTASGDFGVAAVGGRDCPPFTADTFSSCPYVLSVGGTGFLDEGPAAGEEVAAFDDEEKYREYNGFSSGMFATWYPRPQYQDKVVPAYVESIDSAARGLYNASNRAYTDISALGQNVEFIKHKSDPVVISGTSISSPIIAAMLGLVNAQCKAKGKPRIGWAHPKLYAAAGDAEVYHDITIGGSYGCGDSPKTRPLGFPSKAGYDPATGLGTPHYQGLLKAFGCD